MRDALSPSAPLARTMTGADRLRDAQANKGTAYSDAERRLLGIDGLLPPRMETLQEQAARIMNNVRGQATPLDQYRYLSAVRDENETLFYRVVLDHLDEMLPIIYTPTVGQACIEWSRIYERPRGLYLSAARHRGRVAAILRNWLRPVEIIVVTDGGRILGLGDLGANGMGIPIGKLSLYTACAGVPPDACLPITLDVGSDNDALRDDPLYLGDRHPRLTGPEYDSFLEEFVSAVQAVFPGAVLQFEDFNNASAFRLLDRYRSRLCCFNDDVQGTGAMGLAGLYSACRVTGRKLSEQRVLFVGAGEACLGIGAAVIAAMQHEGLSGPQARGQCLFIDSKGVVVASRTDLPAHKARFAQERAATADLLSTVEDFRPTVLIGASAQPGIFTEPVLRAMARLNDRPVVFALSNPTSKAECTAEQAYSSTDGRVIFASGSPFRPVTVGGVVCSPAQGNNSFIFPGVGLGLLLSGARRVTDRMFLAAARALADLVLDDDRQHGCVFPAASRMREVARAVSVAVAEAAFEERLATRSRPTDLAAEAARLMYVPEYAR